MASSPRKPGAPRSAGTLSSQLVLLASLAFLSAVACLLVYAILERRSQALGESSSPALKELDNMLAASKAVVKDYWARFEGDLTGRGVRRAGGASGGGAKGAGDGAKGAEQQQQEEPRDAGFSRPGQILAKTRRPKHPVVFIPGITSSALELWQGKDCASSNFRDKFWGATTMARMALKDTRCWITHLGMNLTTWRDPNDIKLRPAAGWSAADYLFPGYWVWGKVLQNLADLGYDPSNLAMMSYDWRIAPKLLEDRDGYFSAVRANCEKLKKINAGRKVVLVCHSMGCKWVLYFQNWIRFHHGEQWVADHIEATVHVAPPFLGVPKTFSALFTGEMRDTAAFGWIGREILEGIVGNLASVVRFFRSLGSLPSMLPIGGDKVWKSSLDGVGGNIVNFHLSKPSRFVVGVPKLKPSMPTMPTNDLLRELALNASQQAQLKSKMAIDDGVKAMKGSGVYRGYLDLSAKAALKTTEWLAKHPATEEKVLAFGRIASETYGKMQASGNALLNSTNERVVAPGQAWLGTQYRVLDAKVTEILSCESVPEESKEWRQRVCKALAAGLEAERNFEAYEISEADEDEMEEASSWMGFSLHYPWSHQLLKPRQSVGGFKGMLLSSDDGVAEPSSDPNWDNILLEPILSEEETKAITSKGYSASELGPLLEKVAPNYAKHVAEEYDNRDSGPFNSGDYRQWQNPLIAPLPYAPDLKVYCMYGVTPNTTEVGYNYHQANKPGRAIPFKLRGDSSESIMLGLGDETVPLISLGHMCNVWSKNDSSLNPGRSKVIIREYKHEASYDILGLGTTGSMQDFFRGGQFAATHVEILGHFDFLIDLLHIVSEDIAKKKGEEETILENRILSNVIEMSDEILAS